MIYLKQSTVVIKKLGPFVDSGDGDTPETGLTISQGDIQLSKNGEAFAQTSEGSPATTHDADGWYPIPLTTTDTATLGSLVVKIHKSGALPVWREYMVVPANVYDSLVSGSDNLEVDEVQINGALTDGSPAVEDRPTLYLKELNATLRVPGPELVVNGDFGTGDLTGWDDEDEGTGESTYNSGLSLQANTGLAKRSNSVEITGLVIGQTYVLSGDVSNLTGGPLTVLGAGDATWIDGSNSSEWVADATTIAANGLSVATTVGGDFSIVNNISLRLQTTAVQSDIVKINGALTDGSPAVEDRPTLYLKELNATLQVPAPELVINGDFDTGDLTGWTDLDTGTGASTYDSGTMKLVSGAGGGDVAKRGHTAVITGLTIGRRYILSGLVTGDTLHIANLGGGPIHAWAAGINTEEFTAQDTSIASNELFVSSFSINKTSTIDNISIREKTAPGVDIAKILGTLLTETSGGLLAAAFKKFFDKTSPTGTINSLPDAVPDAAGGLPISDAGGLDLDAILADTTSLNDTALAEIVDVTDIPAEATIRQAITLIYMWLRNDSFASALLRRIKNNAGTVVLEADMDDSNGEFTQGQLGDP